MINTLTLRTILNITNPSDVRSVNEMLETLQTNISNAVDNCPLVTVLEPAAIEQYKTDIYELMQSEKNSALERKEIYEAVMNGEIIGGLL